MALTREMLENLGLTPAQADGVMAGHEETVSALNVRIEALETLAREGEAIRKELDDYKAEAAERRRTAAIRAAYAKLLEETGVDPRRIGVILRATDLSALSLEGSGRLAGEERLRESIRAEWADFILTRRCRGAEVATPPGDGGARRLNRSEIEAIPDAAVRQRAIAENHELFGF